MKHILIALALLLPLRAHAFWCDNCASDWHELAGLAKQAQQYAAQAQQLQYQISSYANMVQNTVALPMQAWEQAQSDIMQVRSLGQASSLLSGNAGGIIGRLQGVSGYASQAASLGNIANQLTMWQQTIGGSLNTMGRTLGIQENDANSQAALLHDLESRSNSAQGQMQALQAANAMAAANGAQLQNIQATLIATARMQANYEAVQADREASQDAATTQFLSGPPLCTTCGKTW